jgi:hypothetical protein
MIGISRRQWLLILTAVATAILINVIGIWYFLRPYKMWLEETTDVDPEFLDLITCDDYPYLAVFLKFLITAILLGALAWIVVFLSTRALCQRLPLIPKYGSELLTAISVGIVFAIGSILLSNNWVHDFRCWEEYGLSQSGFVYYWSKRLVFPVTSVLIFWAMYLSNKPKQGRLEE